METSYLPKILIDIAGLTDEKCSLYTELFLLHFFCLINNKRACHETIMPPRGSVASFAFISILFMCLINFQANSTGRGPLRLYLEHHLTRNFQ